MWPAHGMTGLRKPVDILSRLGHCCNYDTVRKVETGQEELAQYFMQSQYQ